MGPSKLRYVNRFPFIHSRKMKLISRLIVFALVAWTALPAPAQIEVVREWNFDQEGNREHWTGANHLDEIQVKDGALQAVASGVDPFFTAAGFEFPTSPSQAVEIRYRTNRKGSGELYFTNTTDSPYGGFLPKKSVSWEVIGDDRRHTVRIFPGWHGEKKIIKLRIDFPNISHEEAGKVRYRIDRIRVLDMNFSKAKSVTPDWDLTRPGTDWTTLEGGKPESDNRGANVSEGLESIPLRFDVDRYGTWLSLEMTVTKGRKGTLTFFNSEGDFSTLAFPLKADGREHWYNINLENEKNWKGTVQLLRLQLDPDSSQASLKRLVVSDDPQGPPEIHLEQAYRTDALNRTGKPCGIEVRLKNIGGKTGSDLKLVPSLPRPLRLVSESTPPDLPPAESGTVRLAVLSQEPFEGDIELKLSGEGTSDRSCTVALKIDRALDLPKADYVPEPKPVESDFHIGALYFPGWSRRAAWDRIESTHPERKPVLGWYDESNPEVIDWQIKWSLENGIRYYLVDWYWNRGRCSLDHWVKGFYQARYKSMFQWAMMWANHNPPGSHSEEDQRAVTKFWIENYFNTPEYLTRDGRPVVMIWSPRNMDNDIIASEQKKGNRLKPGEGLKRLLDISQETAREAGLKGIFFIAMKWPEASTDPKDIQWLADAGFEMTSIYHFMDHGGKAENPRRFPFDLVVRASLPYFEARHKTGILPYLPNLSTGWDSRPWHGERQTIIEGRDVAKFRKICEDFKAFADKTGIREAVLAPTNEWGEGSYAEPNAEHGFGMFETVREVFCKKPVGGWPVNFGPQDVGLGPYDLSPTSTLSRTAWDFRDGAQGWSEMMGVKDFVAGNGKLAFETDSRDPALVTSLSRVRAGEWGCLVVRMKVSGNTSPPTTVAQLFWSTSTSPISESNSLSVTVKADGNFHEYAFPLSSSTRWRRGITSLRFDPATLPGLKIEIESIRLEPEK